MHVIPVRVLVKEVCGFPQDGGDIIVFATPLSFPQAAAVDCVHVDSLRTMLFGAGVLFAGVCLRSLLLTLA